MANTPGPAAIQTVGLSKRFASLDALAGVDLSVELGQSLVIFGPNGAGKTTLIRILTLGLKPSGGTLSLVGLEAQRAGARIRGQIGVLSHRSLLYEDLSARQNLEFYGALYGVPDPRRRADELLELFDLLVRAEDSVSTFSRGMQQRLALARALVHDPPLVFLDEPFTGLDPVAARSLRKTLEQLRARERTVVLVTHQLRLGLELSDRWIILSRGRITAAGNSAETDPSAFEQEYDRHVAVRPAAARSAGTRAG